MQQAVNTDIASACGFCFHGLEHLEGQVFLGLIGEMLVQLQTERLEMCLLPYDSLELRCVDLQDGLCLCSIEGLLDLTRSP